MEREAPSRPPRERLREIIFEADTAAGKVFDVALLFCIVASVAVVVLDSMEDARVHFGELLRTLEWVFTGLFTLEYLLRLASVKRPLNYALSFFGVVDLLSFCPTYLSLVISGAHSLLVLRALRLLRVFRVLKLGPFVEEARVLRTALRASRAKIFVFMMTVTIITLIMGSLMYVVEGPEHGFTSIPRGVYWAVVTLSTVGYGDLSPQTTLGQVIASLVMILGYGIIAVPTGIVTVELASAARKPPTTQSCPVCVREGHDIDARHCKYCGAKL